MRKTILPLVFVSFCGDCFGVDIIRTHSLMSCNKKFLSKIKVDKKVSRKVKNFAKKALIASAVIDSGITAYHAAPFVKSYAKSLALRLGIVKQPVVENGWAKNWNYFKPYIAPSTFFTLAAFFTCALRLSLSRDNMEAWQSDIETENHETESLIISEDTVTENEEEVLSEGSSDATLFLENDIPEKINTVTESNEENTDESEWKDISYDEIENTEQLILTNKENTSAADESKRTDIRDKANISVEDYEQSKFVIDLIKAQINNISRSYDSRFMWGIYNGQINDAIERVSNEDLKSMLYSQFESLKTTEDAYVQIFATKDRLQMRNQLLTGSQLISTALENLQQSRKTIQQQYEH